MNSSRRSRMLHWPLTSQCYAPSGEGDISGGPSEQCCEGSFPFTRRASNLYKMDGGGVEEGDASGLLARGCFMRSAQGYRRPRELTGPPLSKSKKKSTPRCDAYYELNLSAPSLFSNLFWFQSGNGAPLDACEASCRSSHTSIKYLSPFRVVLCSQLAQPQKKWRQLKCQRGTVHGMSLQNLGHRAGRR